MSGCAHRVTDGSSLSPALVMALSQVFADLIGTTPDGKCFGLWGAVQSLWQLLSCAVGLKIQPQTLGKQTCMAESPRSFIYKQAAIQNWLIATVISHAHGAELGITSIGKLYLSQILDSSLALKCPFHLYALSLSLSLSEPSSDGLGYM